MAQLRLPEVRHHVPGAGIDEREHLRAASREGAGRNIEVDHPATERRAHARVLEVQLGSVHGGLRRSDASVHVRDLADRVLRPPSFAPGLLQCGLGREMLSARRRQRCQGSLLSRASFLERGYHLQHRLFAEPRIFARQSNACDNREQF